MLLQNINKLSKVKKYLLNIYIWLKIKLKEYVWNERTNLPQSFDVFLRMTAKYHGNSEPLLKRLSKQNLCNSTKENLCNLSGKANEPDIFLPFFDAIKEYTCKMPSIGYYLKELFTSVTWMILLLRIIDAVTDILLTVTYQMDWDKVVGDFLEQSLSSISLNQTSNVTYIAQMCSNETSGYKDRLFCIFPKTNHLVPFTVSVIILVITYLTEVIAIWYNLTNNDKTHYQHYCELFSGNYCNKHSKCSVYLVMLLLPLSQQAHFNKFLPTSSSNPL